MVGPILEALERKIELRRDATRAPLRAPEWQRATSMPRPPRNTQISTRPRLTYCGPKLVLTKGSTLDGRLAPHIACRHSPRSRHALIAAEVWCAGEWAREPVGPAQTSVGRDQFTEPAPVALIESLDVEM